MTQSADGRVSSA